MTDKHESPLTGAFSFLLGADNLPQGIMGIQWGAEATEAATRLGLSCQEWKVWEGKRGYETCFDIDHPADAFDRKAYVRLFRSQNRLEGVSLRFMHCGATRNELADAVRRTFNLKATEGTLYHILSNGEVVHLGYDNSDDSCSLTVAGPRFGKAFADYLLETGFRDLADELGPR
jgi:hypothetical protein